MSNARELKNQQIQKMQDMIIEHLKDVKLIDEAFKDRALVKPATNSKLEKETDEQGVTFTRCMQEGLFTDHGALNKACLSLDVEINRIDGNIAEYYAADFSGLSDKEKIILNSILFKCSFSLSAELQQNGVKKFGDLIIERNKIQNERKPLLEDKEKNQQRISELNKQLEGISTAEKNVEAELKNIKNDVTEIMKGAVTELLPGIIRSHLMSNKEVYIDSNKLDNLSDYLAYVKKQTKWTFHPDDVSRVLNGLPVPPYFTKLIKQAQKLAEDPSQLDTNITKWISSALRQLEKDIFDKTDIRSNLGLPSYFNIHSQEHRANFICSYLELISSSAIANIGHDKQDENSLPMDNVRPIHLDIKERIAKKMEEIKLSIMNIPTANDIATNLLKILNDDKKLNQWFEDRHGRQVVRRNEPHTDEYTPLSFDELITSDDGYPYFQLEVTGGAYDRMYQELISRFSPAEVDQLTLLEQVVMYTAMYSLNAQKTKLCDKAFGYNAPSLGKIIGDIFDSKVEEAFKSNLIKFSDIKSVVQKQLQRLNVKTTSFTIETKTIDCNTHEGALERLNRHVNKIKENENKNLITALKELQKISSNENKQPPIYFNRVSEFLSKWLPQPEKIESKNYLVFVEKVKAHEGKLFLAFVEEYCKSNSDADNAMRLIAKEVEIELNVINRKIKTRQKQEKNVLHVNLRNSLIEDGLPVSILDSIMPDSILLDPDLFLDKQVKIVSKLRELFDSAKTASEKEINFEKKLKNVDSLGFTEENQNLIKYHAAELRFETVLNARDDKDPIKIHGKKLLTEIHKANEKDKSNIVALTTILRDSAKLMNPNVTKQETDHYRKFAANTYSRSGYKIVGAAMIMFLGAIILGLSITAKVMTLGIAAPITIAGMAVGGSMMLGGGIGLFAATRKGAVRNNMENFASKVDKNRSNPSNRTN